MICLLLLLQVASILAVQSQTKHAATLAQNEHIVFNLVKQDSRHKTPSVHYHLRWITEQTRFPIELSVSKNLANQSFGWSWERTSDKQFVQAIPDLSKSYTLLDTNAKSSLYLTSYNKNTHEQLSAYQPRLIQDGHVVGNDSEFLVEKNIFSLVYLKKHQIRVQPVLNKKKISCMADFLVSNAEPELIEPIMKQMEKYASFKLAVQAGGKINRKYPDSPIYPIYAPPAQSTPLPAPITHQSQPMQNLMNPTQTHQYPQYPKPTQSKQYSPEPIFIGDYQPNLYSSNPANSYQPAQAQQDTSYHFSAQYNPFNFIADSIREHQFQQQYQNKMLNSPSLWFLQQHLTPQASFRNPMMLSDYMFLYKHKRDADERSKSAKEEAIEGVVENQEEEVSNISGQEDDNDYDMSKFIKIRLTLGPVTLFRPILANEIVSCSLDLINIDEANLDHRSTVYMKTNEITGGSVETKDEQGELNAIRNFLHNKMLQQLLEKKIQQKFDLSPTTLQSSTQELEMEHLVNDAGDKSSQVFKSAMESSAAKDFKMSFANVLVAFFIAAFYF